MRTKKMLDKDGRVDKVRSMYPPRDTVDTARCAFIHPTKLKALSKGFMLRLRAQNALRSARTGFYSFRYLVNLVLATASCCVATAAFATPNIQHWQSASGAGAGYDAASRGPSLLTLEATPSEGRTVSDVEAALRQEIVQLVKDGVSEEELQRVKAQVTAGEVYKLDSLFYQAMQIGQMESLGLGHHAIPLMLERLQAVTTGQVRQVAEEFLQDDNLTVAVLDPQPLSGKPKASQGVSHVR